MSSHTDRNLHGSPAAVRKQQSRKFSRIDWGGSMRDLKSSLTSSWTGGTRGSGPTGPGNSLASAADIVKKSLGNLIDDDDDEAPKNQSKKEENIAPSSRYDPTSMNCILDINELTDDDDDSDDGNYDFSTALGIIRRKRRKRLVVATVGIIFMATIVIGVIVNNSKNADSTTNGVNLQISNTPPTGKEQKLLNLAEQILSACSEEQRSKDKSECDRLCDGKMCCFELDANEEKSKCKEKDCPAYAGCEVLFNTSTLPEGATKNADQKVTWWG